MIINGVTITEIEAPPIDPIMQPSELTKHGDTIRVNIGEVKINKEAIRELEEQKKTYMDKVAHRVVERLGYVPQPPYTDREKHILSP